MRTKSSVNNIISTVIFNLIIGFLGFVKAKVFINGLSNDIYSLNQLFYQIFGYIAIADIGFGLILNQHLYKAFAKEDKNEVNRIYSSSKKFYKYIGSFMFLIAFVLSFFVQFLTKANVSSFYIQLVFIIFIIRYILDYYFIAPRYVLEADQKFYKINYLIKGAKILETIIEIILVLCGINYFLVLIPGIIITLVIDIYSNKKIFKMYPWLKDNKSFDKKYLAGTKNVVWQKLSGLLNSNTDIILISAFINPLSVVIYTSYNYVTKFLIDTIYIIASAITPSYANVLLKKEDKAFRVFTEINIMFLFIASFVMIMLYGFLSGLIRFWVGQEYLVNNIILFCFCFITFQKISERAIIITINSKAAFKETKTAIIIEAILNFGISLILVNKIGLLGVLLGTIISKIITVFIQQPIYVYKNIFKQKYISYFVNYGLILLISFSFIILFNILNLSFNSLLYWLLYVIAFAIFVLVALFLLFYVFSKSFRLLTKRGLEFIKVRRKLQE